MTKFWYNLETFALSVLHEHRNNKRHWTTKAGSLNHRLETVTKFGYVKDYAMFYVINFGVNLKILLENLSNFFEIRKSNKSKLSFSFVS